ncbi:MAG: histidinol-phosphatase [Desulfuromonas sp.]|uniref:PHP domain-containing protein n=1 Tax=Desulfuromonas sp. TaxID=892 RepID=UPI000CABD0B7|nr:PHP domain-containing protein [Desulfuromonas sp.]PLX85343.1 MAG: histidinol-phosphatase [Desulfuromonas sp.]
MRFDLHVHTSLSPCSDLDIADILAHARSRRLDGVCITDHDTMAVREQIEEGIQDDGLCVIFGMEYETPEGDFLLFGPFENLETGLPAPHLLDLVREQGGAAVAAHPFRKGRPTGEHLVRESLCRLVEGINGRNSDDENRRVQAWKKSFAVRECGGSDAHTIEELGRVVTRFNRPVRSRGDLVRALNAGHCSPEWNIRPQPAVAAAPVPPTFSPLPSF